MEKKTLKLIKIKTNYSRRYPDPLNQDMYGNQCNIEHFILLCKAVDVPVDISKKPNPRLQKIDYGIYKEIRESLEDADDLSFHLKNKGITVLAHRVDMSDDKRVATVYLGEDDGIADGAHTYEIILAAQRNSTCPDGQYVKLEIMTGITREMGVEITGGLNTGMQVQAKSLMNLQEDFAWIKKMLSKYEGNIAYMENDNKDIDIREIISFMTIFNKKLFPGGSNHPKISYVQKAKCLDLFAEENNKASYEMLKPILKDILYLVDYVGVSGRKRYNVEMGGRAGAMKGVYASRKRGKYDFIFMDTQDDYKIYEGALYPILGALRFLVEQKKGDSVYSWRLKSLEEVKTFYDEIAPSLITTTYNTSLIYSGKPNPIGKDDNHWDNLYKTVALHFLETRQ